MPRLAAPILLASLLLAACAAPPAPPAPATPTPAPAPTPAAAVAIAGVTPSAPGVGRYELLELTVDLRAAYANPFDPAQVDLWATFSGPGGAELRVPGFYYQGFSRTTAGGAEQLAPAGAPAWKVRFTPPAAGAWRYSVSVTTPAGSAASAPASFTVAEAGRPGFVRRDPRSPHYLAFDSGAPYLAIGQNVGWYGAGGSGDYERWFAAMGASGANFARVWMASWAFGLEWDDSGLGNYGARMDRAWQLDRVFALAAEHEIYIMLALLNHGAFSTDVNPEWERNPYNAALGGPCAEPGCFASDPRAKELFKRRLRYIVARWGYSPNLLAWEWWNEVDWTPMAGPATQAAWIAEMSAELARYDPYGHLRTTSYARPGDDAVWALDTIDIVQRHVYETYDPLGSFARGTAAMRQAGKPALYGEFGFSAGATDASSPDPTGVHLHNGIWAGLMAGGMGGGMSWWWDSYVAPLGLERHFAGPAAFFAGEDPAGAGLQPARVELSDGDAAALALVGPERALGWIKSDAYSYEGVQRQLALAKGAAQREGRPLGPFTPSFEPLAGVTLTVEGLAAGAYTVEWWDTEAGAVLASAPVRAGAGPLTLDVPPFGTDLAFKLTR